MSGCDLLLFGATRNTGWHIARLAGERGEKIAAMVREGSDASGLNKLGVRVLEGDAFEVDDCIQAIDQASPRRVVSLMGGKNGYGRRVCGEGNINVIRALENSGPVERFVLVTSMGCGEQFARLNENVKRFLGEALLAKTEAEDYLRLSGLPWTIVRPGGLNNEPATGSFCLLDAPEPNRQGYVSREDVAAAVLKILDDADYLYRATTVQCDLPIGEAGNA